MGKAGELQVLERVAAIQVDQHPSYLRRVELPRRDIAIATLWTHPVGRITGCPLGREALQHERPTAVSPTWQAGSMIARCPRRQRLIDSTPSLSRHTFVALAEPPDRTSPDQESSAIRAVQRGRVVELARSLALQLQSALATRAIIDQAIGVMMSRNACAADEALAELRAMSQSENRNLPTTSQHLVDDAVRQAETRNGNDWGGADPR